MFWLYLVTDRTGSRAVLHSSEEERAPKADPSALVIGLRSFEDSRAAVAALAGLEQRLAQQQQHVRPSLPPTPPTESG